jgi:S-adenosylmethionine/arginine decarboxylase-like enzyme
MAWQGIHKERKGTHGIRWPEDCYAAIDVFTCGTKVKPKMIIDYIQQKMDGSYHVKKIQRGIPGRK